MIKQNKNYKKLHRIVLTPGEPSGIGPDIVIMAVQKKWPVELVICADSDLLLNRSKQIKLPLKLKPYRLNIKSPSMPGEASILNIPLNNPVIPGQLNTTNNNSSYIIKTLEIASQGCIRDEFSALVTGPINKTIMNQNNDLLFTGHTEFFAKISKSKKTVMLFCNNKFRIALVTTHIPISSISDNITQQSICDTIIILNNGLKKYFGILYPRIYVCGLNPHAGENGFIGEEENTIIIPALNNLKTNYHYNLIGPLPSDTIFQSKYLNNADVILVMYHDQGLPVLKYAGLHQSVNITLGLPFIRTSVGHGSAIELSGTGNAIPNSINRAIFMSIKMIEKKYEQKIL